MAYIFFILLAAAKTLILGHCNDNLFNIFFLFQEVAEEEFSRQLHFHVTCNLIKYLLPALLIRTLLADYGNRKQCKELLS